MLLETIETQRLVLKCISTEEMNFIFENYSKPEIKILLGHRSEEDYLKEEQKYKNGYASYNRRFRLFLLIDKSTNLIIGRCGIHNWNPDQHRAEVGYVMEDENYKQKSLMTEALKAVIKYGFNQLNLNRMEAIVGINNLPSLKLIKKYHFVQEGILRQYFYGSGKHEDAILFSKLRNEYFSETTEKQ